MINKNIENGNSYSAYFYLNLLKGSEMPHKFYADIEDEVNKYLVNCLKKEIQNAFASGRCIDILENFFFGKDIIYIDSLAETTRKELIESFYDYYYKCIEVRMKHNDWQSAKYCYDQYMLYKDMFGYIETLKIEELYKTADNALKRQYGRRLREWESRNDVLVKIGIVNVFVFIVLLVACLVTLFKFSVLNILLISSISVFVIIGLIDWYLRKTSKRK
jgi:hypothetical protein